MHSIKYENGFLLNPAFNCIKWTVVDWMNALCYDGLSLHVETRLVYCKQFIFAILNFHERPILDLSPNFDPSPLRQ